MTTNYNTGDQSPKEAQEKVKREAGEAARKVSQEARETGKAQAEAMSGKAADALEDVEAAMDAEAEVLGERGWDNLSQYIREMADGIGGMSDNLRHKSADELVRSASELARRNTGLFLLGSVAIGFGLSRFAKAEPGVQRSRLQRAADPYGSEGYSYPASESASTGTAASERGAGGHYQPSASH